MDWSKYFKRVIRVLKKILRLCVDVLSNPIIGMVLCIVGLMILDNGIGAFKNATIHSQSPSVFLKNISRYSRVYITARGKIFGILPLENKMHVTFVPFPFAERFVNNMMKEATSFILPVSVEFLMNYDIRRVILESLLRLYSFLVVIMFQMSSINRGYSNILSNIDLKIVTTTKYSEKDYFGNKTAVRSLQQDLEAFMYRCDNEYLRRRRGTLLEGPPGTGKTHLCYCGLSKYINSGELIVIHFDLSTLGSSYVNGSQQKALALVQKLRDIGCQMKENLERDKIYICIYSDEVDQSLKDRNANYSGSSENDKMLNVLLSLIDGMHAKDLEKEGIYIYWLMATNFSQVIDKAVTRSGRIDNVIKVDRILDMDERGKFIVSTMEQIDKFDKGVYDQLPMISLAFSELTQSDIVGIIHGAYMEAIVHQKKFLVHLSHIIESLVCKMMGPLNYDLSKNDKNIECTVVHELGHLILAYHFYKQDIDNNEYIKLCLLMMSFGARTKSLGFVWPSYDGTNLHKTKTHYERDVIIALGGYMMEQRTYGLEKVSHGAFSDLQQVHIGINTMIQKCPFDEDAYIYIPQEDTNGKFAPISENTKKSFDLLHKTILDKLKLQAMEILDIYKNNGVLDRVIGTVINILKSNDQQVTIVGEDIIRLLEDEDFEYRKSPNVINKQYTFKLNGISKEEFDKKI